MTPEQLAKAGTEHAEQCALFCWANMACNHGFLVAWDMELYKSAVGTNSIHGVRELRWLHAIPNGGARGDDRRSAAIRGGRMRAEGVKPGVADIFLPVPKVRVVSYHGLYIEMKRANGVPSDVTEEQKEFAWFVSKQGYAHFVAFGWKEAAQYVQGYLTL